MIKKTKIQTNSQSHLQKPALSCLEGLICTTSFLTAPLPACKYQLNWSYFTHRELDIVISRDVPTADQHAKENYQPPHQQQQPQQQQHQQQQQQQQHQQRSKTPTFEQIKPEKSSNFEHSSKRRESITKKDEQIFNETGKDKNNFIVLVPCCPTFQR